MGRKFGTFKKWLQTTDGKTALASATVAVIIVTLEVTGFSQSKAFVWPWYSGGSSSDCGNGSVEPNEQCDDGNTVDTDSCTNGCMSAVCGDYIVRSGFEECDDGTYNDDYGYCTRECVLAFCGDGICNAGEDFVTCSNDCDDPDYGGDIGNEGSTGDDGDFGEDSGNGAEDSGNGADNADTIGGTNGDEGNGADSGDETGGNVDGGENGDDGDGPPFCGDGVTDDGEECDDGNEYNFDDCTAACLLAECGDGYVNLNTEECDEAEANSDNGTCTTSCKNPVCGDGFTQVSRRETCDDGNIFSRDGCSMACRLEVCGNGIIDAPGENCEDHDVNNGDGCSAMCVIEDGWRCVYVEPLATSICQPICGDGLVVGEEPCDDGNEFNTDDCTNHCSAAVCGDSIIRRFSTTPEECDDGNAINNDECTNNCMNPFCTDGIVQALLHEQCDHGFDSITPYGACPHCRTAYCGDGNPFMGREECDDGNPFNTDVCTSSCKDAICGDGIVNTPVHGFAGVIQETCDDRNTERGDGCDSQCLVEEGWRCVNIERDNFPFTICVRQ